MLEVITLSFGKAWEQFITFLPNIIGAVIVFLMAAADILRLTEITDFLKRVLLYIPNIFVAILILIVAALVAEFLGKFIRASMEAGRLSAARFIGSVAKWSVWVFALFAALLQLGVAPSLINIIITGFVAMIAIGGGLAFGLGGKDSAKEVLDKIKKDIS